jgi:transcription initiation factor TFIIIB Brf1 subunit/transcription initiation factor TFIIB
VGEYEMHKCKSCGGNSFVKVPEFEKELTVCLDCGEVASIRFVNPSILKKYINPDTQK